MKKETDNSTLNDNMWAKVAWRHSGYPKLRAFILLICVTHLIMAIAAVIVSGKGGRLPRPASFAMHMLYFINWLNVRLHTLIASVIKIDKFYILHFLIWGLIYLLNAGWALSFGLQLGNQPIIGSVQCFGHLFDAYFVLFWTLPTFRLYINTFQKELNTSIFPISPAALLEMFWVPWIFVLMIRFVIIGLRIAFIAASNAETRTDLVAIGTRYFAKALITVFDVFLILRTKEKRYAHLFSEKATVLEKSLLSVVAYMLFLGIASLALHFGLESKEATAVFQALGMPIAQCVRHILFWFYAKEELAQ